MTDSIYTKWGNKNCIAVRLANVHNSLEVKIAT